MAEGRREREACVGEVRAASAVRREVGFVVRSASGRIKQPWVEAAKAARSVPTPSEAEAWELLRDRRCLGLKFRRQQILWGLRADFYCAELGVVLELDGSVHAVPEQSALDEDRTNLLEARGLRVLRLTNDDLSAAQLERLLLPLLPPHTAASLEAAQLPPLPLGRGGAGG